jgi:hypothetical protein
MEVSGQASRTGRFTPVDTAPDTRCVGDWVGPRADLKAVGKRKHLAPTGNRTQAVQPVARRYTDWAIPAPRSSIFTIKILKVKYRKDEDLFNFKDADSFSAVTVSDGRILVNDEPERMWPNNNKINYVNWRSRNWRASRQRGELRGGGDVGIAVHDGFVSAAAYNCDSHKSAFNVIKLSNSEQRLWRMYLFCGAKWTSARCSVRQSHHSYFAFD